MAEVNKNNVYISKGNLEYVLGKLRDKNEALYLRKGAEAVSAAKVKNALTLTVGGTDVVFDGSVAKSAAVAAASHKHTVTDINDFSKEVKKVVFGDENSGTVAAHTHSNLTVLEKISDEYITAWNAKIGVNDVEKLKYINATAMPGVDNVKTAIDILVKNIQINSAVLSDATANVNGLATKLTAAEGKITELENANKEGGAVAEAIADAKKAAEAAQATADEAKTAVATEQGRAQAAEKANADAIAAINNETTGILAQAKTYADGKDAAIAAAKKAGDDAQKDVDALAGKVGTVAEGKTVVELIADAEKAGTDAAAAVVAEQQRAQQAEQAALKAGQDAQGDVDALEAKVGEVPADKTVVQMIAEAQTNATYDDTALKGRVATIEGDYLKAADKTELQGKIDTVSGVANAAKTKIDTFMAAADVSDKAVDTLKEIQDYITSDGTAAQEMTQNIAANAKAIKDEADRAKAAEKVNADAIAVLNGADTEEGSVAKAVKEAKEALQANIDKKVDQTVYNTKVAELAQADATNLAAAKQFAQDEDKKITDVIGTADDLAAADTLYGKIKALQEKDTAQDQVIGTKAAAADLDALEALVGGKADTKDADTAFGKIAAEAARADAAEKALGGRIDTANGKITALENELDAENTGLKARMTAAEADIDGLEADMTGAKGDITNINANITAIQNQIAVLTSLTDEELQAMLDQVYTGM